MDYKNLLVDHRGEGIWISLNRPDAMNALNLETVVELEQAFSAAEQDPRVRVIVITGKGRAFCAGADLKFVNETLGAADRNLFLSFVHRVSELMAYLASLPKPVIAAVNGLALAGGLELVLSCDLVIAAEKAKLGDAHANFGLLPGAGSSYRLPRKIGPTRAKMMLFTGEFFSASDFLSAGLVNQVVPEGELETVVETLVKKIASKSPLCIRRMKTLVDDSMDQATDTAMRLELLALEAHSTSKDMREGLAAFNEKRAPRYTGE